MTTKELKSKEAAAYVQYKTAKKELEDAERAELVEATKKFIGKYIKLKRGRGNYPLHNPMGYQYIYINKVSGNGINADTFFQESVSRFCFQRGVWIEFRQLLRTLKKSDVITKGEYESELKRYISAATEACTTKVKEKTNYQFGTLQKPDIRG